MIMSALAWMQGLGHWAPPAFVLLYAAACVLLLPGSVLTIGAGVLFGLAFGVLTVFTGAMLGACAAFLLGRTVGRGWILKRVSGDRRFAALDEAVGLDGFRVVLLARLCPVLPFSLLNYAFGLTAVTFRSYAAASGLGMLPGIAAYVYVGSAARSLAEAAAGGRAAPGALFWVGMAMSAASAALLARMARRALGRAARPRGL